jgi:hypothetical protein
MKPLAIVLLIGSLAYGIETDPLKPVMEFDAAFANAVDETGDLKNMTKVQHAEAMSAIDKKITPLLTGTRPWSLVAKVKDVVPGEDHGYYVIAFDPHSPLQHARCEWIVPHKVQVKMTAEAAAKVHQGDYLTLTGIPLRHSSTLTPAKNNEITRRINRGLSISVGLEKNHITADVILTDTKISLPK